jgi:hypothetical protein
VAAAMPASKAILTIMITTMIMRMIIITIMTMGTIMSMGTTTATVWLEYMCRA